MTSSLRLILRRVCLLALSIASITVAPPDASAVLKEYCRRIQIDGSASGSPVAITFQVVDDRNPQEALITSCAMQPVPSEGNLDFIRRLPYRWTNACPVIIGPEIDLPTNVCVNGPGPDFKSCKIKTKIAPKATGEKKYYVDFCCYEEPECKTKLGSLDVDPTPIPITVKVAAGGADPCPEVPPVDPPDECAFDLAPLPRDGSGPMRLGQPPSGPAASCRSEIASSLTAYMSGSLRALVGCNAVQMKDGLPPDCTVADDPNGAITELAGNVHSAVGTCQATRSPTSLRFGNCPAPCDSIDIRTCSAGLVGNNCASDYDCDSAPTERDGRCGQWPAVADCLTCLSDAAVDFAIAHKYGNPPLPAPVTVESLKCMNEIGDLTSALLRARAKALIGCQKRKDEAKKVLPAGVTCKDEALETITAIEQKVIAAIAAHCDPLLSPDVLATTCGGTAADFTEVGQCVVDNGRALSQALSHIAFPESAPGASGPTVVSPVDGSLMTCEPSVVDRYRFNVTEGQVVDLRADTVNPGTASDLCFGLDSGCDTGDSIIGDEELPCTFPSPNAHGCPQDSFIASGTGTCVVEVTECIGDCANAAQGDYELTVTRNGLPAAMKFVADDEPD